MFSKRRIRYSFIGVIFIVIVIFLKTNDIGMIVSRFTDNELCYDQQIFNYTPLDPQQSVLELSNNITTENNIFFHETSCLDKISLSFREACAVESAAKLNPESMVYVLFATRQRYLLNSSNVFVKELETYKNVKLRTISIAEYIKNTPLDEWYASGAIKKSKWPQSHMSDVLRYLTLWKFPGIYLDLDIVVVKSFNGLINFSGAEDHEDIAAGVLSFGNDALGRQIADACIRNFKTTFRGDLWGNNGPGVITRVLQKLCGVNRTPDMTKARCHDFTVFPPSSFYPIGYKQWERYFTNVSVEATMKELKNAYIVHVWNKFSQQRSVEVGNNSPYDILAKEHCPKIYQHAGKTF